LTGKGKKELKNSCKVWRRRVLEEFGTSEV
jgi:hypothetical protein